MSDTTPATVQPNEKEPNFFAENKKLIITALIVILMLLFITFNLHQVAFSLVFFSVTMPMVVVILTFFFIGAITAWVYAYFNKRELKRKVRELEKKLKQLGQ